MKNLTTLTLAACAALTLTACGGDSINGMGASEAAVACQKHLAQSTPGISLGDFSPVSSSGIRKVAADDGDVWQINGEMNDRAYQCTVHPKSKDAADVDGAFAG